MDKEKQPGTAMALPGLAIPSVKDALSVIDEDAILGSKNELITSIDTDSPEGRRAIYNAKRSKCQSGKDYINRTLNICHFVMHRAGTVDEESGEPQHWIRTVLILDTGEMVEFGSQGIVASLADLCRYYRNPPWNPPLSVFLKAEPRGQGKTWYSLQIPDDTQ
jgi:Phage Single-stranded DNA-binding protein